MQHQLLLFLPQARFFALVDVCSSVIGELAAGTMPSILKYVSGQCIGGCDVYGPPLSMSNDEPSPKRAQNRDMAQLESLDQLPFDQVCLEGFQPVYVLKLYLYCIRSSNLESTPLGNHSRNTPPTMKGRLSFPSKSTDTLPSTPFFYNLR